jgi:hypothetical protein
MIGKTEVQCFVSLHSSAQARLRARDRRLLNFVSYCARPGDTSKSKYLVASAL